ncbi:MAG: histidinol dehydrogenase [Clostridiales bacterium]|nr:histidinol dehydrogenase [Clostridiales bacterium]
MIKIFEFGQVSNEEIFARNNPTGDVSLIVKDIIENVITNGDDALKEYSLKFDGASLDNLEVTKEEIDEAFNIVEPEFIRILKDAAENIREFHLAQKKNSFIINNQEGVVVGQKVMPIEKVGLYVPGGTAAYPSTVLMDSIPAKIAGCKEICITTPPLKNGKVNPVILAAAKIAGVDRIFKVGGAQAVAALAYGTKTVTKVDKIVGPGNAFVAEAKRQVFGMVDIDMIAGPSEILVVADKNSNPQFVAADLLSQAEHDKNASAVLVTDSMELAKQVQSAIEEQLKNLSRYDIARASIDNNGKIIVAPDIKYAIDIANEIAPEHLELAVENPFDILDSVKNAGSVFMGRFCPEALGDYFAGPNHTLPTSGTARFSSPLSVDDFVKKMQYSYYTQSALEKVAKDVAYFANKEGLDAHANSALIRMKK